MRIHSECLFVWTFGVVAFLGMLWGPYCSIVSSLVFPGASAAVDTSEWKTPAQMLRHAAANRNVWYHRRYQPTASVAILLFGGNAESQGWYLHRKRLGQKVSDTSAKSCPWCLTRRCLP
jgi:hypothetical protein